MKIIDSTEEFPPIVYKYRDWANDNHQRMLTDGELWMASPATFNDPFDCRIPKDFTLLSSDERKEYIDQLLDRFRRANNMLNMDWNAKRQELYSLIEDVDTFQMECEKFDFAMYDSKYGVLSLSSKWDQILMWSHYASNHTGFCVGFFSEKLKSSKKFNVGEKVIYGKEFPRIHPLQDVIDNSYHARMLHKSDLWGYEDEYRLMKIDDKNEYPGNSWRKITINRDAISEVILGVKIDPVHKSEIVKICQEMNIPVFQAIQLPRVYEIGRERVA